MNDIKQDEYDAGYKAGYLSNQEDFKELQSQLAQLRKDYDAALNQIAEQDSIYKGMYNEERAKLSSVHEVMQHSINFLRKAIDKDAMRFSSDNSPTMIIIDAITALEAELKEGEG